VRVLVFHGYLLHGTGSNVYNANVAEALARAGHEVHLVCQERDVDDLGWVDATADWDGGGLRVVVRRDPPRATLYRPDIAGLLPVYVADRYAGVEARPFPELSAAELDRYLERNVAAVREVAERVRPDVALANHAVMGPAILRRALEPLGVSYAVKIHGSALEYTVKPHPRFRPYALEGLEPARGVLVGSRHTAESLWAALGELGLEDRTRLGPPGVDVARFRPRPPDVARAALAALPDRLAATPPDGAEGSSFARDPRVAARALADVDVERDRLVVFVGKLIGSKGVELLLAAWPLIAARVPEARLVVVGFGAFAPGLRRLADRLERGDLAGARELRDEEGRELPHLAGFLSGPAAGTGDRAALGRVLWPGRLDHAELAELLPAAEAMVVPSTFPEAFGMVAAEAAACGTYPVVARHSGLQEVAAALAPALPAGAVDGLTFGLGPGAVEALAECVAGWLEAPEPVREATREALAATVQERFSWDGVARGILDAAQGRLDGLPRP
jgi:glycosyltransferase involved in cell wall biosynthesis